MFCSCCRRSPSVPPRSLTASEAFIAQCQSAGTRTREDWELSFATYLSSPPEAQKLYELLNTPGINKRLPSNAYKLAIDMAVYCLFLPERSPSVSSERISSGSLHQRQRSPTEKTPFLIETEIPVSQFRKVIKTDRLLICLNKIKRAGTLSIYSFQDASRVAIQDRKRDFDIG